MDETESSETDNYESQLKEVFYSCDTTGSGSLKESELNALCEKLHLSEHANFLVSNLLNNQPEVKFEDFKECFVALLTQSIPSEEVIDDKQKEDSTEREVSPKFTLGRKKYGRRSRPASLVEDENFITSSSLSLLSSQDSSDISSSIEDKLSKNSTIESASGKRPISPNEQQPPMKSGRMGNRPNSESANHEDNSILQTSDTETDFNHSFESNYVEYLHDTWKKLGIGHTGYLNVEELALVCEHIGMDMTEEVVAQLFEKLDCDQDGQISFEEFSQGLLHHGELQNCDSPLVKSESSKSAYNESTRDDHQISNSSISGIFSSIDTNNTGYADASSILELWESLELPCSSHLLEELGFNTNVKINLADLTSVLEEVLVNALATPLQHLAFISFQNEIQFLRQTFDQVCDERNKLRVNVEEANTRAALLAQEVDDNHTKLENSLKNKLKSMEKKYQEQMKVLMEELQQERELINSQSQKLKQQLQKEMASFRDEEAKFKSQLNLLEQENNRLEQELQEMTEKYLETQKSNEALQKELSILPNLKEKLADMESRQNELQEYQHESWIQEIERHKKINQELQDKIDELTLEVENIQTLPIINIENESSNTINRTHSWLSDYKKTGSKRRGTESSSDDNSDDESPTIGKIRRTFFPFEDDKSLEVFEAQETLKNSSLNKTQPLKGNQPSSLELIIKDMFLDQARLMKKLQISEEKQIKAERCNRQLLHKCQILHQLLKEMSKIYVA